MWVNLDESNDSDASVNVHNGANSQEFHVDETTIIRRDWTEYRAHSILTGSQEPRRT